MRQGSAGKIIQPALVLGLRHGGDDLQQLLDQLGHAGGVLGGERPQVLDAQTAEVLRLGFQLRVVHLVDDQQQGLAELLQQPRQLHIRPGQFGADVGHHHNGRSFFERDARLAKDLRGDQVLVFGDNAAGVHHTELTAVPARCV